MFTVKRVNGWSGWRFLAAAVQMPDCDVTDARGTDCWLHSSCAVVYFPLSLWQLWDLAACRLADTNSGRNRCWKEVKKKNHRKEGQSVWERGVKQKALLQNLVSCLLPDAFEGGIRHVSGTLSGERYICSMSIWYANRKVSVWAVSKRNDHSKEIFIPSFLIPNLHIVIYIFPPCGPQKESF